MTARTPLVIAHRGASARAQENTPAAFELAVAERADYIELDVHADAEGELVVTHEAPRPGADLPRLADVTDAFRGRIGLMVELKRPSRYRRHEVVRRTLELLSDDDVLLSFERGALEDAHRRQPSTRTLQHVGFGVSIRRAAGYAWGVGFHDGRVTGRGLEAARALGLETIVYTVNDPARMRELAALGVGGIVTDRPALARRALARSG